MPRSSQAAQKKLDNPDRHARLESVTCPFQPWTLSWRLSVTSAETQLRSPPATVDTRQHAAADEQVQAQPQVEVEVEMQNYSYCCYYYSVLESVAGLKIDQPCQRWICEPTLLTTLLALKS